MDTRSTKHASAELATAKDKPNLGRHAAECRICSHVSRAEIELEFISWRSPAAIAKQYKLANRATVYRHAHALGLFPKRQRNVRAALEKIIERAGEVEVNAAAVVSAVSAYARINTAGQWVERSERVDLNQLFDRMSTAELEGYARDGTLPEWFTGPTEPGQDLAGLRTLLPILCEAQEVKGQRTYGLH